MSLSDRLIVFSSKKKRKFFFSTNSCQHAPDFIRISTGIPHQVVPRPSLPDGIVRTKEDLVKIYHSDQQEIPNPNPEFQG